MPRALPALDTCAPVACGPLAGEVLDDDAALGVALRLKALADPGRVRLLSLLLCGIPSHRDDAPAGWCTCDLAPALGLSEPTVSHHLGVLRAAGLVSTQRSGVNAFHTARRDGLAALCRVLDPGCC